MRPENYLPACLYKATPEFRRELPLAKTTLHEILATCDPSPPPEVLCKVLRAWRNTTPAQKAAWEDAAADPLQN